MTLTPGIARFVGMALAKGMSDQVPAPTNIDRRGAGISCRGEQGKSSEISDLPSRHASEVAVKPIFFMSRHICANLML